jgi:hypothetical protein
MDVALPMYPSTDDGKDLLNYTVRIPINEHGIVSHIWAYVPDDLFIANDLERVAHSYLNSP